MSAPIPPWPGEQVVLSDQCEVFVRTAPPAPFLDEPVLYVHGLAGSANNWTDVMDMLGGSAVDLPGFGCSPPPGSDDYSIDAQSEVVAALIRGRHDGPVHLFGNSLGGAIVTRVAARSPELVRTLTLVSPALPDLKPRFGSVRVLAGTTPGVGPWAIRRIGDLPPERRVRGTLQMCFADPKRVHPDRISELIEELKQRDGTGYADRALVGSARALVAEYFRRGPRSLWREAATVEAPVLVLHGREDRLVDPRMAARASQSFRNSRAVVLPNVGHVAQMERPEIVAREFRALLDDLAGAVGAAADTRAVDVAALGAGDAPASGPETADESLA